jgi:hypothetical protein
MALRFVTFGQGLAEGNSFPLNGVKFPRMLYTFAREPAVPPGRRDTRSKKAGRIKPTGTRPRKGIRMGRIIKALVVVVIFGFVGLTVFAYLGDLGPQQTEVKKPVVLNAD